MDWKFLLALSSAVLNVVFILDFICYAFCGMSLAAAAFDSASLSDLLLTYYPEMTSSEFLAANGILLGFSAVILSVSIWATYYTAGIVRDCSGVRR